MNKLLLNEWIKYKHSKTLLFSVFIVIIMPIIVYFFVIILNENPNYNSVTFEEYMGMNIRAIVKTIGFCFYTYIGADLMAQEFYFNTLKSQLTIPVSRRSLYMSKIIFGSMVVVMMAIMHFIVSILLSFVIMPQTIYFSELYFYFILFIKSVVLMLPSVYFSILLVLIFKNKFIPMAINLTLFLTSFIVVKYSFYGLIPFLAPYRIIFVSGVNIKHYPVVYSYLSLYIFVCATLFLGHHKIQRIEV